MLVQKVVTGKLSIGNEVLVIAVQRNYGTVLSIRATPKQGHRMLHWGMQAWEERAQDDIPHATQHKPHISPTVKRNVDLAKRHFGLAKRMINKNPMWLRRYTYSKHGCNMGMQTGKHTPAYYPMWMHRPVDETTNLHHLHLPARKKKCHHHHCAPPGSSAGHWLTVLLSAPHPPPPFFFLDVLLIRSSRMLHWRKGTENLQKHG